MQKKLDILSLGPGKIEQLTIEAKEVLLKSKKIYCRFSTPLLEYFIQKHKKVVISFRSLYDNLELIRGTRGRLYKRIAEFVINEALNNEGIVYALPGSAFILEDTTYLIYKIAKSEGLKVNTILGISFIDVLLSFLPEKYKKYICICPQIAILMGTDLDIAFNVDRCSSYIIPQLSDLVRTYKPQKIKEILSRHYSKDFKFLYIYNEDDYKNFSYEEKVIEFQAKDIKKIISMFGEKNGSIFIPPALSNYEVLYKKRFDTSQRYKGKDSLFLADLKFQESQVLFKLKRYNEALISAQESLSLGLDSKRKGIHFLAGVCLEKCKKYQEALLELKKAEKIDAGEPEINFFLFNCYRNIGQIEQANKELDKAFIKLKKHK